MWCGRYLPWIGEDRLKIMSYELATLLHELDAAPIRFHTVLSDIWCMCFGLAVRTLEPRIFRYKMNCLRRGRRSRVHA
jgi:hypothetical protein